MILPVWVAKDARASILMVAINKRRETHETFYVITSNK